MTSCTFPSPASSRSYFKPRISGTPWRSNNTEDSLAVERHAAFQIGVFSDPLYTTGDWPQILKDTLPESYLPRFTPEESASILGSADFYAIDPYRSQFIRAPTGGIDACVANFSHPMWPVCNERVSYDAGFGWAAGVSADPLASWLQATPVNFRAFMSDLHSRWPTDKIVSIDEPACIDVNLNSGVVRFRIWVC